MKNVIIKDGKIYSESFGKVDVFEIVDKIPTGFFVWNIGDNMGHDEYIPVCQDLRPGDKDSFEINARTLTFEVENIEETSTKYEVEGKYGDMVKLYITEHEVEGGEKSGKQDFIPENEKGC